MTTAMPYLEGGKMGQDEKKQVRCAEFDLWLHLLREAYEFVASDPINSMATEKMNYVLREMGLARRR